MTRTAVISAFNPLNSGMYSVDLAAAQFFDGLDLSVTHLVTQDRVHVGRLRFELLRDPAGLAGWDNIIYWGDFLNNPMWGKHDYVPRELKHGWASSAEQAWKQWCALYLEARQYAPRARIFSIGGCFLGADAHDNGSAGEQLRGFLNDAELITPRDERSLELVRSIAPGAPVEAGMDCAWLLDPPAPTRLRRSSRFAVFLGRTLKDHDHEFIRTLEARTGLKAVWLDWLKLGKAPRRADRHFRDMRGLLVEARFVVTDTYHLTINALNCGTPTVCLYDGQKKTQDGTLGDYKKFALLEQLGLLDWLVDVSDPHNLAERIALCMESASDEVFAAAMTAFRARRDRYRHRLREALATDWKRG